MVFLLRKLPNYNSSNLLNDLFRTSRLVIRGQGVTEDPYSTRLRSKFEFHVSCRLKVGKVLKFDTSKFGFIIQILAKRSASGARSNLSGAGAGASSFSGRGAEASKPRSIF